MRCYMLFQIACPDGWVIGRAKNHKNARKRAEKELAVRHHPIVIEWRKGSGWEMYSVLGTDGVEARAGTDGVEARAGTG